MSSTTSHQPDLPWWKEPTKDQWFAYLAAWLGWTLDAFDFTIFVLVMAEIAKYFDVSLTAVSIIFTFTLWLRLVGATAAGWMADRMGRKAPLMISILWYSFCNLFAGLSGSFGMLVFWRTILGIGMGAEWPAGAALAMESWPARSRGFMSGVLQGSWGLGFALAGAAYNLLYHPMESIAPGYGWRGMLILGVLPALVCVWIRYYVKEPEVWAENQKQQQESNQAVTLPLFAIFKKQYLFNTLTGCLWMAMNFVVYYSIWVHLKTYLVKEQAWTGESASALIGWGNILVFVSCAFWGAMSDKIGRRMALMIPCTLAIVIPFLYLGTNNATTIYLGVLLMALIVGGKDTLNPAWLAERFPTEIRATASGFVYHQGAIWGGMVAPTLSYLAVEKGYGFAQPMLWFTVVSLIVMVVAIYLGPETKGKVLVGDLEVFEKKTFEKEEYP